MAHQHQASSFLHSLTKPKGVLLAAPIIIGAALVLSAIGGGDKSIARDSDDRQGVSAGQLAAGTTQNLATGATDAVANKTAPIRLAAADKPAQSGAFSAAQREQIGQIVREYLLQNPEVLVEVSAQGKGPALTTLHEAGINVQDLEVWR